MMMTKRRAACCCGQLSVTCEGEPLRISMCHCLACPPRRAIRRASVYRGGKSHGAGVYSFGNPID